MDKKSRKMRYGRKGGGKSREWRNESEEKDEAEKGRWKRREYIQKEIEREWNRKETRREPEGGQDIEGTEEEN